MINSSTIVFTEIIGSGVFPIEIKTIVIRMPVNSHFVGYCIDSSGDSLSFSFELIGNISAYSCGGLLHSGISREEFGC